MKRLIWLPLAGFLIIAGAAAAVAAPTISAVATGAADALTEPGSTDGDVRFRPGDVVEQVLADLVQAGTITQEQSDAMVEALASELEARRTAVDEQRELLLRLIEDGVIAQDEIDQLPADSPLREIWNGIADDGQVSLEQLRALGPGFGGRSAPGHAHAPGPLFMGPDAGFDHAPDLEPAPDASDG